MPGRIRHFVSPREHPDAEQREKRHRLRLLVLEAKKIPFFPLAYSKLIFVPPLALKVAAHEICAFESEQEAPRASPMPGYNNWLWVCLLLCLLPLWDGLRHGAADWRFAALPYDPEVWAQLGSLQAGKVFSGQWWRIFTALTLHGDAAHLFGNCLFGGLFLVPLCRRQGLGVGFFLAIWGGALGNILNAFFQGPGVSSIGFSSAVFAAVGGLCGAAAAGAGRGVLARHARGKSGIWRKLASFRLSMLTAQRRKIFSSLAAGLAFLAFLGGSGEPGIDFGAHALGLVGGFILAVCLAGLGALRQPPVNAAARPADGRGAALQSVLLFIALAMPVVAWYFALAAWRS